MRASLRIVTTITLLIASLTLALVAALSAATTWALPALSPTTVIPVTTILPGVAADSQCSLIEAIENANADAATHADCPAGSGADTIELAANASYTLTAVHNNTDGNNGLPPITSPITLNGHDSTIARSTTITPTFRFFRVTPAGTLTLNDLTLTNGSGVLGGTILNNGHLTVNNSTFRNNAAGFGAAVFNNPLTSTLTINNSLFEANTNSSGGTLYNQGIMTVSDSQIINNDSGGNGAGIINNRTATVHNSLIQGNESGLRGGGIFNNGDGAVLSIYNSAVLTNTSGEGGGGIGNFAGNDGNVTLFVNQSLISGNSSTGGDAADSVGGGIANGIYAANDNASAVVEITDSTISNNEATNGGGLANIVPSAITNTTVRMFVNRTTINGNTTEGSGIQVGNGGGILNLDSQLTVVNSTISGNAANGTGTLSGLGGGLTNVSFSDSAAITLTNVTIASNTAISGTGIANGSFAGAATITSENTLVAANDCLNASGVYTSLGHNLEQGDTCNFDQGSDQPDTNPMIGPLANNGGPNKTHALLAGSPAINQGANPACANPPVNGLDQRGAPRPQGTICDIGAYELLNPADLVMLKTAPTEADAGQQIDYTLTVTNTGADAAAHVVITDTLPGGTNFVTASLGCTYHNNTHQVVCQMGNLDAGSAESLTVSVTVPNAAGLITNTAVVAALSPDPQTANNNSAASTTITVEEEDLILYLPLVINQ